MKILLFIVLCLSQYCNAQVTLILTNVPKNTSDIFIAGSFNNWNPGDPKYRLTKGNGSYFITLTQVDEFEFKFTQGSWNTVEINKDGSAISNHKHKPSGKHDTLFLTVDNWANNKLEPIKSTAQKNVIILPNFYIPQWQTTRTVRILLPLDYKESNKFYPVLYMHDAQNLFDDATSFSGEWGVDETMNKLQKEGGYGCIIVGVDNGEERRRNEYIPFDTKRFGKSVGDAYADFIALTLKPYIDSAFRTIPMREFTGIGGSSLGGVISQYIAIKYPEKFSKTLIFSPAYWSSDSNYLFTKNYKRNQPFQMVLLCAALEGGEKQYQIDMLRMKEELISNGFDSNNIYDTVIADGAHKEWFWKREFEGAFLKLFGNWEEIENNNIRFYSSSSSDATIYRYDFYISTGNPYLKLKYFINKNTYPSLVKMDTIYNFKESSRVEINFANIRIANLSVYIYDDKKVYYKIIDTRKAKKFRN